MKVKKVILCLMFLLGGSCLFAQNKIIVSGLVSDKTTKEPLIGITVTDKSDKSVGTVTDVDGNYTLSVSENATLVFSYIGYQTVEIPVKGRKLIDVQMNEDTKELETVVVVGALMKKSDLTGAAVRITAADLKEIPTSDLNKAMQGKVPGVYIESDPKPGASAKIRVRGNNSIQYGQEPIYVVDNVIVDRAFDSLNPDDIASIDVLKDASATALYGSRGANGVIVVTTKKGSKGRNQVTYDVWFGSQSFTKEMPMLSTFDLRDLRIEAGVNAYMDANPGTDRETAEKIFSNPNVNRNPIFTKEDLETLADSTSYNWLDEVVRSGFQQNHSLAISGGSETGSYYIGLGYNKQIGQLVGSDYERLSGKINMEQQVKPWLRVGTNTTYTYADENPVGSDDIFPNSLRISPLTPISAEPVFLKRGKAIDHGLANPLRDKYISRQNYQTNFINSTFANIRLMEGLDLRSTGSINIIQREEYVYYPSVSAKASSEKDGYASAELRKSRWTNWQWDNTLSYNKTFAEVHRLGAIVGTNTSYYGENWNWLKAAGFQNDLFTFKKLDGATRLADSQLSSDFNSYSMMSYWARANYVYDSRYYLTATVRRDGSSRFGPENKWGTFPSVVGSWNVTGEEFMAGQTIFNNLRVRLGYGLSGNQNIPNYRYMTLFSPRPSLGSTILENDGMFGNPNLKWEVQKQFNTGLDISLLNSKLNLVFDYFLINNDDLLMERTKAGSSGYLRELANVGAMENKGIEISVNANLVETRDFSWGGGLTFSSARNKITRLYDGVETVWKLGGYSNNEIQREGNLFVGESINNIYVYKFDRIVQESDMDYVNSLDLGNRIVKPGDILPEDRDHNGIINDKDRYVVGNTDPDFYGGIHTTLAYKGLSLNVVTTYSVGADRISYLYETLMDNSGLLSTHEDMKNRWTPENTNTNIPRAYNLGDWGLLGGRYGVGETDWAVQDASFFRISTMTLAYNFPTTLINKAKIGSLRVYVTGNNLFTFTKYKGFDPEGGDWYPTSKMYVVGLNLSF